VEVFRQCECSGQPVSMAVINRALQQSARASAGVPMWALRRDGRESEARQSLSDGVDLAAFGGCDAGTDGTLGQRAHVGLGMATTRPATCSARRSAITTRF